jgi:hypothetical protein
LEGADAGQIADAAVAVWAAIDKALSPVIGQRGSAALFQRSLHLTQADYPWLGAAHQGEVARYGFDVLRAALAQQTAKDAAAAHDRMLHTFIDQLAALIGASLTQRLLRPAWESPSSGHAALDTSP